jgi:hypothetical protein
VSARLIALSGKALAAAAASATLFRSTQLLSISEAWAGQAARCSVTAPLVALSGVTLDTAAASATLSIKLLLSILEAWAAQPLAARCPHG